MSRLWCKKRVPRPLVVKHCMRKISYPASDRGIVAQAPCRADLAGGTIDLWPLYLFHPDALTLNFAVNILTTCRITPLKGKRIHLRSARHPARRAVSQLRGTLRTARRFRLPLAARLLQFFAPKEGLLIETDSESPAGAGISGSSALMIATTAALARFTGRHLTLEQMRVIAQNVEAQIIQVPTGCQDYYPALYGGVSAIHLDADGIHREAVPVAPEEIESRFVLAYTGAPRQSGINNWEVFKAHINGDRRVFRNFERIVAIAQAMHQALLDGDWDEVARLLREEWKLRRTNAPGITTPLIDKLISVAARHGGRAAKACGAGGGGCVIFLVEEGAASRVATAIGDNGGRVLPLQVARDGLRIVLFRSISASMDSERRGTFLRLTRSNKFHDWRIFPSERRYNQGNCRVGVPYEPTFRSSYCCLSCCSAWPWLAPTIRKPSLPHLSHQTRMDLIRAFNSELVYIRSPFPMGKTGLTLKDGQLTPSGEELQRMIAMWGPAVKPGDQARISQILVKSDRIHFEINGGPVKKEKWYQHIQFGGGGGMIRAQRPQCQSARLLR